MGRPEIVVNGTFRSGDFASAGSSTSRSHRCLRVMAAAFIVPSIIGYSLRGGRWTHWILRSGPAGNWKVDRKGEREAGDWKLETGNRKLTMKGRRERTRRPF